MGTISLSIIIFTVVFSYQGLRHHSIMHRFAFRVDAVLQRHQYKRLVTSGFLHVSWTHLLLNMISLYAFSGILETYLGVLPFLFIYFTSLAGGNLFALLVHRNNGSYSAVGASGAVSGIIFASIALFPNMGIGFFGLPFSIPSWFYGMAFVLYSIYGIRSQRDNIGHEAHLGGALMGMMTALLLHPQAFSENYLIILAISVPTLVFIYAIITRPHFLLVDNYFFKKRQTQYYSIDHRYNAEKRNRQQEVDAILEKIHKKGMKSLTARERELLSQYSKTVQ